LESSHGKEQVLQDKGQFAFISGLLHVAGLLIACQHDFEIVSPLFGRFTSKISVESSHGKEQMLQDKGQFAFISGLLHLAGLLIACQHDFIAVSPLFGRNTWKGSGLSAHDNAADA